MALFSLENRTKMNFFPFLAPSSEARAMTQQVTQKMRRACPIEGEPSVKMQKRDTFGQLESINRRAVTPERHAPDMIRVDRNYSEIDSELDLAVESILQNSSNTNVANITTPIYFSKQN